MSLLNDCLIEIENKNSIDLINLAKQNYNEKNILCLFFHYNDEKIQEDLNLISELEKESNLHINYIDISKIYSEAIKINHMFNCFNDKFKEHKYEVRYQNILLKIKEEIKETIFQFKKIPEYKGI